MIIAWLSRFNFNLAGGLFLWYLGNKTIVGSAEHAGLYLTGIIYIALLHSWYSIKYRLYNQQKMWKFKKIIPIFGSTMVFYPDQWRQSDQPITAII